jgi:hypothetical protein
VARNVHGDLLGDSGADHVPNSGAPEIVEQQAGYVGRRSRLDEGGFLSYHGRVI